jgi:hypothetical protein
MYDSQAPAVYSPVSDLSALDDFSAMESPSGVMPAAELLDDEGENEGALALEAAPLPEPTEPMMLPESMRHRPRRRHHVHDPDYGGLGHR